MVKGEALGRNGGPAQPHTTLHAEARGSQLFGRPTFRCQATAPPSMTGEFLSRKAPPGGPTWEAPREEATGNREGKSR